VTQILNLLKLAPEIKTYLAELMDEDELRFFTERRLRRIATRTDYEVQREEFQQLRNRIEM